MRPIIVRMAVLAQRNMVRLGTRLKLECIVLRISQAIWRLERGYLTGRANNLDLLNKESVPPGHVTQGTPLTTYLLESKEASQSTL